MLFYILCTDKSDHHDLRAATRSDHLAYIEQLVAQGRLITAGPIPSQPSNDHTVPVEGSLIIAEFTNATEAQHWADNDPYAKAGLFESVSIKPYRKVLP